MECKILWLLLSIFILHQNAESANILGIFTSLGKSHSIQGHILLENLAEHGHNVTMVTCYPNHKRTKNFRELVPERNLKEIFFGHNKEINAFEVFKGYGPKMIYGFFMSNTRLADYTLADPVFQELIHNPDVKYDLVIYVSMFNEPLFALAHHLKVPFIVYSLTGPNMFNNDLIGNPSPYAYVPIFGQGSSMTFFERVLNTISFTAVDIFKYFIYYPAQDRVRAKYFPNSPNIYDLKESTSLLLLNSHNSISQPRALTPNTIEIGGYQAVQKKPLPTDLQKFLDNAKEGVIYVSLGSSVQSAHLPAHLRNAFVEALSKVKQKVLWKWDEDVLPGQSKNIKTSKWFPQSDLLGHPNIKLFITHGGWGSLTEAISSKVPVVGIPIGADQYTNIKDMEEFGYGVGLNWNNFTTTSLTWAINKVVNTPSYKEKVEEMSELFLDREINPADRLHYWVDYVIRTKGAKHLKSPALKFNRFQLLLLDVIGFLILVVGSILFVIYFVIKKVLCRGGRRKIEKKEKSQ